MKYLNLLPCFHSGSVTSMCWGSLVIDPISLICYLNDKETSDWIQVDEIWINTMLPLFAMGITALYSPIKNINIGFLYRVKSRLEVSARRIILVRGKGRDGLIFDIQNV